MSQEEPNDLSALDSLFSKYGQGTRGLSEDRKKQIYAGSNQQEDQEHINPTHKTLKAILDYQETIPDQEVDEFVTKIRDTRLLDDYPDDNLGSSDTTTAPAYNPWPLDEDTSSIVMADPLSGDILVTDLNSQDKAKPEEDDTLITSSDIEDETHPASSNGSDIDDEEAEDLTAEFEKEGASGDVSSDHHAKKEEDGDEDLIPRIDDDVDKDQSVTMDDVVEEEEEEEEEEKEKEDEDETDSIEDTKDNEVHSRTNPVEIIVEPSEGTLDKTDDSDVVIVTDDSDVVTVTDGKTSEPEGNAGSKSEKRPQKKKEDVPDFETFLEELGVDPKETLDVEVQKSRARLSRVGPLAQRRPMTKRFSGGDEDRSKWMFVDSTERKPQRSSIDEEEEEEEKTPVKAPAPQPASKPGMRKPPGGIGLGPMVLPGLGAALGGSKLKKTPTNTPNKTFQRSVEESKVTVSRSETTRTTPLLSLKKTPPPASKAPPTTATKPLLNKPKPLAKPPRPVSHVTPTKEPSQPAWLKELKSKPKPEVKETKKEEEKLNSDILHPKTTSSETAPKTPSWMTTGKTKTLPPIPSSSSTPKQRVESSTPNVPQWKQELMKKKKAPAPPPISVNKSPIKSQILPKSPSKSPARPPIARKPGLLKKGDSIDKDSSKPSQPSRVDKDPPKPSQPNKGKQLKRDEESKDETDSKKIKLSQSMDSTLDEDKMEVTLEVTPQVSKDDQNKDDCQGKDVEMKKEEEKEEEVKVVKTEEKKVIILTKEESENVESKPIEPEECNVNIFTKSDVSKETVKEKQDEGKNKGGVSLEIKKEEKEIEKPVTIIPKPKTDKENIEKEETSNVKPEKIVTKTDSEKDEPKEEKQEEIKVTVAMKSDSKTEETKLEQKKVTIVTEDKNNDSDLGNIPQWKREARERMQKRKMSGGNIVPLRSPKDTIETNSNNNTPQWKKDLVEKRKLFPRMPSLDNEEKGSVESQKSEKLLKRHTIAADVPTINMPAGHKTGMPTWKQELEKKNARLAKHLAAKDAGPEIKPPIEGVTQQPVPELS